MRRFRLADYEQELKWVTTALGFLSTVAIINNWYPLSLFLGLPFSLFWIYFAWLRTEPQLKYVNIMFALLYGYGIANYYLA